MTTLREAAQQALESLRLYKVCYGTSPAEEATLTALRAALAEPERRLTDEIIAELWYKNGTHYHHFARAIERWLKGE